MSSPGSQGNGEFGTRDLSPSPLSGLGKVTGKEKTEDADITMGQGGKCEDVTAVGRETDHDVDKPPNPSQEAGASVLEISPAVDPVKPVDSSVSKVVISDENEEKPRLNEGDIPGSAAETRREIKSVKASQVPECSEEKVPFRLFSSCILYLRARFVSVS